MALTLRAQGGWYRDHEISFYRSPHLQLHHPVIALAGGLRRADHHTLPKVGQPADT